MSRTDCPRKGVEVRPTSIRIAFRYEGRSRKETLYVGNSPMKPTAANIMRAYKIAADVRGHIRYGTFEYANFFPHSRHARTTLLPTVGELLDDWVQDLHMDRQNRPKRRNSTKRSYRRMKDRFWKPHIGHLPINQVKPADISNALLTLTHVSNKTYNNYLAMLSSAFEACKEDDLIKQNPCEKINRKKTLAPKPAPFSKDEATRIVDYMRSNYHESVYNYFEFRLCTGLRTSEALALEWNAVDLANRYVWIDKAVVQGHIEEPKNDKHRKVRLTKRAYEALVRQVKWKCAQGERVFQDPETGEPWDYIQKLVKQYWGPALKALGISYRRPYNLRHTYATVALMAGVNPTFVALQMGHSVEVLFKHYARWLNDEQDYVEIRKIDQSLNVQVDAVPVDANSPYAGRLASNGSEADEPFRHVA